MSAKPVPAEPVSAKPSAFLEIIIGLLLPFFQTDASDHEDARAEVIDTLASFGTHTRAELLQAAQIIALSMTTLDVLAEARSASLDEALRIRHRSCANGLVRATRAAQQTLDRNLARHDSGSAKPGVATSPRPSTPQAHTQQLWAGAMTDTLQQMGIPFHLRPGG